MDPRLPCSVDQRVGARIRERRLALGMSQNDLAAVLEVTFQQVAKYERGFNRVTCGRLALIAQALGKPPGWFFEETDNA